MFKVPEKSKPEEEVTTKQNLGFKYGRPEERKDRKTNRNININMIDPVEKDFHDLSEFISLYKNRLFGLVNKMNQSFLYQN